MTTKQTKFKVSTGKQLIKQVKSALKKGLLSTMDFEVSINGWGMEHAQLDFCIAISEDVNAHFQIKMEEESYGDYERKDGGSYELNIMHYKKLLSVTYMQSRYEVAISENHEIKDIALLDDYLRSVFHEMRVKMHQDVHRSFEGYSYELKG